MFAYKKANLTVLFITATLILCISSVQAQTTKVYLLAGQSNMVGWTSLNIDLPPELQIPQVDVQIYSQGSWDDLGPGFGRTTSYFGPEVTFGRDLASAQPDENIVLIKYAVGGTDLANDWRPPDSNGQGAGPYYMIFMDIVINALLSLSDYEIVGMIWMQGEADAWQELSWAQAYEQNLTDFIQSVRSELGQPYLPFVIGQISASEFWTYNVIVRQAQLNVSQIVPDTGLVITTDLPLDTDNAHYTSNGVMTLGERFADEMMQLVWPGSLTGPVDGMTVDSNGTVLSCTMVEGAVSYQLLFGPDPNNMEYIISDTLEPPLNIIKKFPYEQTYWTVSVLDGSGTETIAPARVIFGPTAGWGLRTLLVPQQFQNIQAGIDAAKQNEKVLVAPGTYYENLSFNGDDILVTSIDPNNPAVVTATVLNSISEESLVTFTDGETADCVLAGFTVIGNNNINNGGGISCIGSDPTILNCSIKGNQAQYGGGILCDNANPTFVNCVIVGNRAQFGGGIYCLNDSSPVLINCTFNGNSAGFGGGMYNQSGLPEVTNCIFWDNISDSNDTDEFIQIDGQIPIVSFSCIQDQVAGDANVPFGGLANNNIDANPLFVRNPDDGGDGWGVGNNDNFGDLRLLPGSACIDAGDGTAVIQDITDFNGNGDTTEPIPWDLKSNPRFSDDPDSVDSGIPVELGQPVIDIGAYEFFIKSADFNADGVVNLRDFAIFSAAWQSSKDGNNWNPNCDISEPGDDVIDQMDFMKFITNW